MMSTIAAGGGGRWFAVVLLGLLIAACSPSTTVNPSPSLTPSASVAPTASPSATPTASPSPSPSLSPSPIASTAADPADGLAIAAPYTLTALDPVLEASFRQQFAASAGAFGSLIGLGGRGVVSNGTLVGYVLVIGFPTGIMSDAAYQSMLDGIATSSQLTFEKTTISGVEVSSGSTATAGLGVYRAGDDVIITITPTASSLGAVTTALVAANH